ncbi:MAG: hypothetical protein K2M10_07370 [Muribaculaceae bacterium]|nr:hypothetical protein [Muribaculaceae bacterium]
MNNYIFKGSAAILLLACGSPLLFAQGYTAAALEKLKQEKLWFHTSNAAGQVLDNTQNYSEVEFKYEITDGSFHRPQQGQNQKSFDVNCEGFMNLTNAFVWGEFSFEQRNINESRFNASIVDPYRGMPYFMADEHVSDWRNQYYNMKFRASTPLYWGHVAFGVEGVYRAALAAKQLDPRVDTRYFQLEIAPGVVWHINKNHNIGANFYYSALKEDSRMQNVNVQTPQTYYLLYGLGVAAKNIGDGESMDYHGHILGFGAQYNFRAGIADVMAQVDYTSRVENFDRDFTDPKKDAGVDDKIWKYGVTAQFLGSRWNNQVTLKGQTGKLKGIQYINEFDNSEGFNGWVDIARNVRSEFKTQTLGADYTLFRNRCCGDYVWRLDAGLNYMKNDDKYILPYSYRNSENLYTNVDFKYNFKIGKSLKRRLLVGVGGGYNANLSGTYMYGGVNEDYPTVTELEIGDWQYMTSNWYNLKASAEYSQQLSKSQKMNFFGRAEFNYVKTSDYDFNHRSYVNVAIGVNF